MIITRTPLRVSFFGGGTDYPAWFQTHGGAVLATTVDKYIYVLCRYLPPFFDHTFRISYSKMEHVRALDDIYHPSVRECLRYLGLTSNLEIHTDADLPARTGLGSSSTFTVGLLNALHAFRGELVTKARLAEEATHIERDLLRENVGCQDQLLAAHGGLNRIEFSASGATVHPIPLPQARLESLESHVMLFFTGITRAASPVAGDQLQRLDTNGRSLQEMHSMVKTACELLTSGNGGWREFGALLHEGWKLKRSLSPVVSTNWIDETYEAARRAGAYGGKLLGAGGGGFLLILADPEMHPRIKAALDGFLFVPVKLEWGGTQIIFYQPSHQET